MNREEFRIEALSEINTLHHVTTYTFNYEAWKKGYLVFPYRLIPSGGQINNPGRNGIESIYKLSKEDGELISREQRKKWDEVVEELSNSLIEYFDFTSPAGRYLGEMEVDRANKMSRAIFIDSGFSADDFSKYPFRKVKWVWKKLIYSTRDELRHLDAEAELNLINKRFKSYFNEYTIWGQGQYNSWRIKAEWIDLETKDFINQCAPALLISILSQVLLNLWNFTTSKEIEDILN